MPLRHSGPVRKESEMPIGIDDARSLADMVEQAEDD